MATSRYPEAQLMIAREELIEHALVGVLKNATAGIPVLRDWVAGTVRKTPLVIYDINGQPLFYDFEVGKTGQVFGNVRVAACQVLGTGVLSSEIGERAWNFDAAVKKLTPLVKREFKGAKIAEPKLVCYSYPKLGVMFEMDGPQGPARAIYDVASFSRVPERKDDSREGFYAWSVYDAIPDPERKQRVARFKKIEAERVSIKPALRKEITAARVLTPVVGKLGWTVAQNVTHLLEFCNHYGHTHARSHHCFALHGQQVNDYCSVATCQMILCFYRYYYTQDQIAPALGYTAGDGCPRDVSAGYKSLTCNHLDSSFDEDVTWEKARDQINLHRPFKSGISGHARACAGYSYSRWSIAGSTTDKKLYIYDPWPWNADYALGGAITWEDWDAITHTNYVYANIDCA